MKKVGIIGRTNVGKSTLFNRLIKLNRSIVSDVAGTTRDFISKEISIGGSDVELIDFGGFDFGITDTVEKFVQKNILENIKGLDLVIFLVDGKCALGDEDRKIAEIIRKSRKPTILVINKVDGKKQEEDVYDYFSLGFDDVIPVSAINNKNLDELILKISAKLKIRKSRKGIVLKKPLTHIAIIGKPNVGKSSLFNLFYGGERSIVTDIPGTTRDSVDAEVKIDGKKYIFVDTAGLRRKTKIGAGLEKESSYRSIKAINHSNIVLYVLDVNSYATGYDVKLLEYAWKKGKAMIVVVNKWDIRPHDMTEGKFKNVLIADNSIFKKMPFVFVSAVRNTGLDKLTEEIKRIDKRIPFEVKTSFLNKEVSKALLEIGGIEQKIYYVTQISKNPIEFLLFVNKKVFFGKKHLGFIENKLRNVFELEGVPIFLRLREKERD